MLIDVYDFLGSFSWCRYAESSREDVALVERRHFMPLLVYPREQSNQLPYLQTPEKLMLDDFILEDGTWDYSNSFFIWDIMKPLCEAEAVLASEAEKHLRDFFAAMRTVLELNQRERAEQNILLVPDHYGPRVQELILRGCGLSRQNTTLLWRSVAALLGAEEQLASQGVRQEEKIAVIDSRDGEGNVTILAMKEKAGRLVPQRRSFSLHKEYFPMSGQALRKRRFVMSLRTNSEISFAKHAYGYREGALPVFSDGTWRTMDIRYTDKAVDVPGDTCLDSRLAVVLGGGKVNFFPGVQYSRPSVAIGEGASAEAYVSRGAGRFAVRRHNKLPTYVDYREAFSIVCIDPVNETVVPEVLIAEKEDCDGGEEYVGKPIEGKFFIDENTKKQLDFYLMMGTSEDTPLKELTHHFEKSIGHRQYFTLVPKMVVGQGFAIVHIEGKPLLQTPIQLNFLEMRPSSKTIASLNEELSCSFPVDIPQVRASDKLWRRCENEVLRYLSGKCDPKGDWFAKSVFPYRNDKDYARRLQRENVFGTDSRWRIPTNSPKELFNLLFQRLASDYEKYYRTDAILLWRQTVRLIAWTYQWDNPVFEGIKQRTMRRLADASRGLITVAPQEYTLCAYFANRPEDYMKFVEDFCMIVKRRGATGAITNWLRTFFNMLLLHNDMLETISTSVCEECMSQLEKCIGDYHECALSSGKTTAALRVMLFLLKRRRYDHNFMKKKSDLWERIHSKVEMLITMARQEKVWCPTFLPNAVAFKAYLEGSGELEGIIQMVEDGVNW